MKKIILFILLGVVSCAPNRISDNCFLLRLQIDYVEKKEWSQDIPENPIFFNVVFWVNEEKDTIVSINGAKVETYPQYGIVIPHFPVPNIIQEMATPENNVDIDKETCLSKTSNFQIFTNTTNSILDTLCYWGTLKTDASQINVFYKSRLPRPFVLNVVGNLDNSLEPHIRAFTKTKENDEIYPIINYIYISKDSLKFLGYKYSGLPFLN